MLTLNYSENFYDRRLKIPSLLQLPNLFFPEHSYFNHEASFQRRKKKESLYSLLFPFEVPSKQIISQTKFSTAYSSESMIRNEFWY